MFNLLGVWDGHVFLSGVSAGLVGNTEGAVYFFSQTNGKYIFWMQPHHKCQPMRVAINP